MGINKNLIIQLLAEDMKHEQLIAALRKIGFESDIYGLKILEIVAGLMGIAEEEISWEWSERYVNFMNQVKDHKIKGNGKNLLALAEECYQFLKECAEREVKENC
jgi:lambda repressor-like predicted transcriptional regulator